MDGRPFRASQIVALNKKTNCREDDESPPEDTTHLTLRLDATGGMRVPLRDHLSAPLVNLSTTLSTRLATPQGLPNTLRLSNLGKLRVAARTENRIDIDPPSVLRNGAINYEHHPDS